MTAQALPVLLPACVSSNSNKNALTALQHLGPQDTTTGTESADTPATATEKRLLRPAIPAFAATRIGSTNTGCSPWKIFWHTRRLQTAFQASPGCTESRRIDPALVAALRRRFSVHPLVREDLKVRLEQDLLPSLVKKVSLALWHLIIRQPHAALLLFFAPAKTHDSPRQEYHLPLCRTIRVFQRAAKTAFAKY